MNLVLLRRAFTPLARLTQFAGQVAYSQPGYRIELTSATAEVVELAGALNQMLSRLETEQRESARRVVAAQEAERRRIAQELHDEVGQTLTAIMLELDQTAKLAPPPLRRELEEAREQARSSLDEVRRIALELRPEALDDLGLASAVVALCDRVEQADGLRIQRAVARDLPHLGGEQELVLYRVAQEALTNVLRHSGSETARVSLARNGDRVVLEIADEGRGFVARSAGAGLQGMRERANLIGAALSVAQSVRGGVTVRLEVRDPLETGGA